MIMAKRHSPLFRWSRGDCAVRAVLALLTLVLGYQSITYSLALTTQNTNPVLAHKLAPGNGRITATVAATKFAADQSASTRFEVTRLAQRALLQDAMAVQAVTALGLQAQLRGDTAKARLLFDYANTLSRRDLQVQLWTIEDAIARGDIPRTLHEYDVALRTSKAAPDLLFPVLSGAISEGEVRRNLVKTLAKRPQWANDFVSYVANAGVDPKSVISLFVDLHRSRVTVPADDERAAITRLIQVNETLSAWNYYSKLRRSPDRRSSRDPQFAMHLEAPTPFDWVISNDASVSASIDTEAGKSYLNFVAPSSVGGSVVQQMQFLLPGRYQIEGLSRGIDQPSDSTPYWSLSCWRGRELGQVVVPSSGTAEGRFSGMFSVPADCPVQMLTLFLRASDAVGGVSGQIDQVRLKAAP